MVNDIKFAEGDTLTYGLRRMWTFGLDKEDNIWIFGFIDNYVYMITPSVTISTLIHEDLHMVLRKIDPELSNQYDKFETWLGQLVVKLGVGITRSWV